MLNGLLKIWVRSALPFFARRIRLVNPEYLSEKGPLVLALNHPNSFLDAILLGAYMKNPVYYLARGDVFRIGWVRRILGAMNMLPIYRIRDGKDKLGLNEATFVKSREVLSRGNILLVFVEGFCQHQTTLQLPLKKGAPRVIESCWRQGIPVRILPVWLRYSSFDKHPKEIEILLGEPLLPKMEISQQESPVVWQWINDQTTRALLSLEQMPNQTIKSLNGFWRTILFFPAGLGAVLHAPLYLPACAIVRSATKGTVHYDSALFVALLIAYPFYLLLLGFLLANLVSGAWFFLPIIFFPLLARFYVMWQA